MFLFSVIIPVFNRKNLINKTLESIFNQNFYDFEIIVIDDGSTDGTLKILEEYSDRIKVFHQENKGPGEARNLGIRHAQGQYIVFLDSDDLWFPWTLSIFEQVIKEHNFPSFIAGNAVYFQKESELLSIQPQPLKSEYFLDYYAAATQNLPFLTSAVAIKRMAIQQIGGFTEQRINSEDNDLWLKLGTVEKFVYIHAPVVLGYRRHESSAIANITKTYQGTCHLIRQEEQNLYPGGKTRWVERLEILTRHVRPVSLACLDQGEPMQALSLYQNTFIWHLKLLRFRYLIAFPTLFITTLVKNFLLFIPLFFSRKMSKRI